MSVKRILAVIISFLLILEHASWARTPGVNIPGVNITGGGKTRKVYVVANYNKGAWQDVSIFSLGIIRGRNPQVKSINNQQLENKILEILNANLNPPYFWRSSRYRVRFFFWYKFRTRMRRQFKAEALQTSSRQIAHLVRQSVTVQGLDEVVVRLRMNVNGVWYSFVTIWQNVSGSVTGIKPSKILGLYKERGNRAVHITYFPKHPIRFLVADEPIGEFPIPSNIYDKYAVGIEKGIIRVEVFEIDQNTNNTITIGVHQITHNGEYDGKPEEFLNEARDIYLEMEEIYGSLSGGLVKIYDVRDSFLQNLEYPKREAVFEQIVQYCGNNTSYGNVTLKQYINDICVKFKITDMIAHNYLIQDDNTGNSDIQFIPLGSEGVTSGEESYETYCYSKELDLSESGLSDLSGFVINPGLNRDNLLDIETLRQAALKKEEEGDYEVILYFAPIVNTLLRIWEFNPDLCPPPPPPSNGTGNKTSNSTSNRTTSLNTNLMRGLLYG